VPVSFPTCEPKPGFAVLTRSISLKQLELVNLYQFVHFCTVKGISAVVFFPQQQNFAMGSLAQISFGPIRCSFNTRFRTRFRRVLVQIPREVPGGSGADSS
jgi:hypothetical protein